MAQELSDKIRAAAQAKGIDPDIALRIARAESAVNPAAQAKTSSAGGLFQVVDKTWKEFGGKPGKKYDPDENIRVGTDIIAKNTQTLRSFLNRDPRPAEIYAAHYFGPSGAKSFLSAEPGTPIVDILGKQAVKANPNLQGKNVGQVMAQLEKKMGSAPAPAANVSRETPAPARQPLPPSLPPMAATEESSAPPSRMASLGPSYQAALALSFLADTDDKEDRDIDREPGVAEKWLAEQAPRPAALAEFSDISIKSPFAALEPRQPVQMFNEGGEVDRLTPQQIERLAEKNVKLTGINKVIDFVAQRVDPQTKGLPTSARTLLETVQGGRSRITEANFSPEEIDVMRQLATLKGGDKGSINYADYVALAGEMNKQGKMPASMSPGLLSMADPMGNVQTTLGQFRYQRDPKGNLQITDTYDFNPPNPNATQEARTGDYGAFGVYGLIRDYAGERIPPGMGRDVRVNVPPVKRSGGGEAEPTPEEIAAASRPATVNPNIRRQGEAARRLAAMRDVNTLPDPRTYAAVSGFLGQAPDEMGFSAMHPDAEGIKKAGQAGFGVGTALQVAPVAAAVRGVVGKGTTTAAKMMEGMRDMPVGMSIKPVQSIFSPIPSADAPFVGRLDEFVSGLPGPVQKDQFLGMLKGKMRDTDIARAESTLADLPGNAKLTPVDLLNRIKTQYDPALIRTTVRDPREAGSGADFWNHVDNPYRGQPVGVIHMSTFVGPEQAGRIKSLDQLDSKLFLASQVGYNSEAKIPGLDALRTDAIANTQVARLEEARQNLIDHSAPLFEAKRIMNEYEYPGTSPAYNTQAIEAALATAKQNGVPKSELTAYAHNLILENIRQPAIAKMQQLLGAVPTNDFELRAAVRAKQGPLWDDQRRVLETELAGMVPDIRRYFGANASKFGMESSYKGKDIHLSLDPPENAAGFSRFVEQTVQDPDRGPLKGIHLLEIQSDMTSELKEGRKAGLGKKQVFSDMPGNRRLVQQLGMKNAISAAINRGDQFVTFPGKESAKPQLYESVRDNLKAVAKDLGPGFEIKPFTFTDQQGNAIQHYGITWGPEAATRTQQKGVPFKDGGAVERQTADHRKYL